MDSMHNMDGMHMQSISLSDNNDGLMRRSMPQGGLTESKIERARKFLYDEDDSFSPLDFNNPSTSNFNVIRPAMHRSISYAHAEYMSGRGSDSKKNFWCTICIVAIVLGCVLWGIAAAVSHGNIGIGEHTNDKRIDQFQTEILALELSSESDLQTAGTPQYHALKWVADVDEAKVEATNQYAMQRYALAVLFYSTAGTTDHLDPNSKAKWIDASEWLTPAGFCSWHGVFCIANQGDSTVPHKGDGDVLALDLVHNGLVGGIPSELAALTELHRLELSQNGLTGKLPKSFQTLTRLRNFVVHKNKLTGTIPKEYGTSLTNMRQFNVGANELNGSIPGELEHMIDLRSLGLDKNKLKGTIPDLEDLTKLNKLYLDDNELEGPFPESIPKLTSLVELNLSGNHLTGFLPADLAKLTKLEVLILEKMNLRGTIPAEIFTKVTRLTELVLTNNHFSGQVPTTIGHLKDLQGLFLDENKLSGSLPRQVGLMADLKQLHIEGNSIGGSIPNIISSLNGLESCNLSRNAITGTIPPTLGTLHRLVELHLESNQLEGKLPTELGELVGLKQARLYENNLTGAVPDEVCTLITDEDLAYLGVDCANGKVTCKCCTKCF